MKENWSLDILYKGYDDPAFNHDLNALDTCIESCNNVANTLSHTDEKAALHAIIKNLEELSLLSYKLFAYVNLRQTTDTTDSATASYIDKITKKLSNSSKAKANMNRYIAEIENLDSYIKEDSKLAEYSYFLKNIQKDKDHLLSEDVEDVLSKMDISGGQAWEMMQSYLTSTLEIDYDGKKITLPEVRNLAYSNNQEVRKKAYEAELASYQKIRDAIAFSINNIKAQVLTECELRGFESPLSMTLYQAHMKQETLDAMLSAMEEYMPIFHKYLRRKAEMLGYENGLPWYELFAPMGKDNTSFTLESAKNYLIKHFSPFAPDMAEMMEEAFDQEWIDFYPRKGKVGGAFCENLPFAKQSRILTNFDGTLGSVVTLSHELGHAYHGMMIQNHHMLNTDYSMPVAETASTFNENIIMNAAIDEASGETKLTLIENQLQDLAQIMCDIYSRFLFEKSVFENRKNGFIFPEQLEKLMLDAQKKAYGDGLDPNYLHPYMWINKGHYYSSSLSFYNFPYAFGGLFARGLIVKYNEMKEDFVPKYRKLLNATTISDVEDVAKLLDIDLTTKEFWIQSLKTCEERVNEFIELSKQYA